MRLRKIATAALAVLLVGCSVAPSEPPPPELDFTQPQAAQQMVTQLIEKIGSQQVIMVEIRTDQVTVSAIKDERPVTWAYRDRKLAEVPSDLAYVDQATFNIADFNIADVGAVFRAAAGVSGSEENQILQIVDYSGGQVMMSVATNPESRTVFFTPAGALLEDLDFATIGGLTRGLADVSHNLYLALTVNIDSKRGIWIDYPAGAKGSIVRRQRAAAVPVTTMIRTEDTKLKSFDPKRISLTAIWTVVHSNRKTPVSQWSVVIEDSGQPSGPRMSFTIDGQTLTTNLLGVTIT
ncbi:MAG: hypothetical protein LBK28_01655 [Propionibacteriaceae bacterium]|jgi:hypothetical protein|nr:hypothetical protein [Propionibacteriaceae bacterium]